MRSLHRTLLVIALLGGVATSVWFAVLLGEASDSRRHPLDGSWRAEFLVDTTRDDLEPVNGRKTVRGTLHLRLVQDSSASSDRRFWLTRFAGSHTLRFMPVTGEDGADDWHLYARRSGRDSVGLIFGGQCNDCGVVVGRARIAADTLVGVWQTSSWGKGTSGRFRLVRVSRPSA